ncbi:hypothetical protein [Rheinheimera sp.]|uniref:hypothetical protein n=1 Tax=Rheinheimera sp. TaxID=1869214 RepID=UPI0027BA6BD9|nr:hypothetical protein [Rheinheimera sp.]
MRALYICVLLLLLPAFQLSAAEQMWLLLNNTSDSRDSRGDVDIQILALLRQLAPPELNIEPLRLGDARTWKLLREQGNYCALSKIRTAERETFLLFSQRPTSVYPPIQLISNRRLAEDPVDLELLLSQNPRLKIGMVQGRSYGEKLDALISQHPNHFYQRSGEYAAETLLQMLAKNRLDALIEFAATVRGHQPQVPQSSNFVLHQLLHQPVIMGYLVCPQSTTGKQLIQLIDTKMQLPHYRQQVVELHRQYFTSEDFLLIEADLQQIF